MTKQERMRWEWAQALADKIAPEKDDPLAFWCLVEAILAVNSK
ncbi:hypothetical protein [Streptococcus pneumoniae]|nr:hypothetical protein [Streptococcus pneumoniae]